MGHRRSGHYLGTPSMMDDRVARLDRQLANLHAMFHQSLDRFEAHPSHAELDHAMLIQQVIGEVDDDLLQVIAERKR